MARRVCRVGTRMVEQVPPVLRKEWLNTNNIVLGVKHGCRTDFTHTTS